MRKIRLQSECAIPSSGTVTSLDRDTDLWHTGGFGDNGTWRENLVQKQLVMVIDDSPTVRKIIEVSLGREGLEIVSFPDGIEALQAVTNGNVDRIPDLVVLDIELPKMNGFEIARYLRLKPKWNRTVIVILTRHDSIIDRLKARLAGTQVYLTKPFTTQTIVDVVKHRLGLPAVLVGRQTGAQANTLQ